MTKSRNEYIYWFTGTICKREKKQASKESKYAGQEYYLLKIVQADQIKKTLQVFKDKLTNPTIWEIIHQRQYSKGKYLFACRNMRGYYYLVNWEEVE